MQEEATLSFDQIISVDTLEDLIELYVLNGHKFDGPEDTQFIRQVRGDWKIEREKTIRQIASKISQEGVPLTLPSIDVQVDGITYHAHGVIHDPKDSWFYRAIVAYTLEHSDNWLFEHNLKSYFWDEESGIEVLDHLVCGYNPFISGLISDRATIIALSTDLRRKIKLEKPIVTLSETTPADENDNLFHTLQSIFSFNIII